MTVTKCDICGREIDPTKDRVGMIQFLCRGPDLEYEDVCQSCYKKLLTVIQCKVKELKEAGNEHS